ncbi:MAG TPA: hypothetical protein VFZ93_15555 [Albitalea sp.]
MNAIRMTLAACLVAAMAGGALAAKDAAQRSIECEASKSPEAVSTKDRADVKAEAKAAKSVECDDVKAAPKPTSSKQRADVKSEAAAANKSGAIPKGDAAAVGK